ncbi:hypothetical protein GEV43_25785 [Actinomadura sp. J1-007]|nr:hypothetical protein [Actinomadura sp. J1-007]
MDRRALPNPAADRAASVLTYEPPRTAAEQITAEIWGAVLGVERVGVHENFFSLGGDSILALTVVSRMKSAGLGVELQDVFRDRTIAKLVAGGRESRPERAVEPFELIGSADRARLPDGIEDAYPVSGTQASMLYHAMMAEGAGFYHNTVSMRLRGPLEEKAFRQAVSDTIARHPTFRTSFALNGYSEPLQLVHKAIELPVRIVDLRGHTDCAQRAEIDALVADERSNELDIGKAPVIRVTVQRLTDDEFQVTISENHIILDGWSWSSSFAEIFERQQALISGDAGYADRWPQVGVKVADFVGLERDAANDPAAERFWKSELADITPRHVADLRPAGKPVVLRRHVPIDAATSRRLREIAASHGVTLKSIAAAVHLRVLAEVEDTGHPLTGMLFHGRPESAGGDQVRGLFWNVLPIGVDVAGRRWIDLAASVLDAERRLLPHRRVPLSRIQRWHGRAELFDVGFNYVSFHRYNQMYRDGVLEFLDYHPESRENSHYALMATYSIDPPDYELGLLLAYDADRVSGERIAKIAEMYAAGMRRFAASPESDHDLCSVASDL